MALAEWAGLSELILGSCLLAVAAARWKRIRKRLAAVFPTTITDTSAWCWAFVTEKGYYVHAGLELADGGYISGRVVWHSTHLEETGDRELMLGQPIELRTDEGCERIAAAQVIVPAREIRRIYVDEIEEATAPDGDEP